MDLRQDDRTRAGERLHHRIFAFPVALYLARRTPPSYAALVLICVMLPMLISLLVQSYGWIAILDPDGLLDRIIGTLPGWFALPRLSVGHRDERIAGSHRSSIHAIALAAAEIAAAALRLRTPSDSIEWPLPTPAATEHFPTPGAYLDLESGAVVSLPRISDIFEP